MNRLFSKAPATKLIAGSTRTIGYAEHWKKLFHDKCAYCEGSSLGQADWDVEHFRPKGRIAERNDHPGYYWLAYSWENLYPSCQHCNQNRRDRARWGDTSLAASPAMGKLDQFPLESEANRATDPSRDHRHEDPLLLDPCQDEPEEHIRFGVIGDAFPLEGSPKGEASIEICHLNRSRLRSQRQQKVNAVVDLLRLFRNIEKEHGQEHPLTQEIWQAIKLQHLVDSAPFAAVGRWIVKDPDSFAV